MSAQDDRQYMGTPEEALDSETNPELFAGTGIFAVMGAATVESIEWEA